MIRVVMLGRTGNNLFQYALGRVLAKRHGVPLVLSASWFNAEGWRSVSCLRRLGIRAEIRRRGSFASRALLKLVGRHPWECLGLPVIREPVADHRFSPEFLEAPADCVLMGYFQSPGYFESIEEELRRELAMDGLDWTAATRRQAEKMRGERTVAVHARRLDYVGNPELDLCGVEYYRRAMDDLRIRVEGASFHLFSDDPGWCASELGGADTEVVAMPEAAGDPLHDLYLMSCARHHVIANSSYSWWGAWLGMKPGQIVKVPERWYGGRIVAPIEEKLCPGWEPVMLAAGRRGAKRSER